MHIMMLRLLQSGFKLDRVRFRGICIGGVRGVIPFWVVKDPRVHDKFVES